MSAAPPPPFSESADVSVAGSVRRYRVVEAIGKGGFGTVYRAQLLGSSGFRKDVALKVLSPRALADDPDGALGIAERLRDEARLLGLLSHRAVVHVDGLHLLDGRWTVVMEYVPGADLKQLLAHHGPLPVPVALELVEEVARAVDHAFRREVAGPDGTPAPLQLLHRDLKPANVRLTPDGQVKVLDFGVARAEFENREADTRGVHFGSLDYMAPERLDGLDRHESDVYALGALLYELVVGERLGRTSANRERHDTHVRDALATLWERHPDEDLYRLVGTTLIYDPALRPDARGFASGCRDLRRQHDGPWLGEWAEAVLPDVSAALPEVEDDLSGATLVEQGAAASGPMPPTDSAALDAPADASVDAPADGPRPSRGPSVVVVAAITAVLVVVAGGAAGLALWEGRDASADEPVAHPLDAHPLDALDDEPAAAAPSSAEGAAGEEGDQDALDQDALDQAAFEEAMRTEVTAEPAAAEEPAAEESAAEEPAADEPAADEPAADEVPSRPATPAPAAEPPPAAPGFGVVRLQVPGSAQVVLSGDAGTFDPGRVPAGDYRVRARFPDGRTDEGTQITVPVDGQVVISCQAALAKCLPL